MENSLVVKNSPAQILPAQTMTREQVDLIKSTVCRGATDEELKLFLYQSNRLGMDPLQKQVHGVKRWDSEQRKNVLSIQISVDGFRLIAERTGEYEGQTEPMWAGEDGIWKDIWVEQGPPVAARVGVYRKGHRMAAYGVAYYRSFCQTKKDGAPMAMWAKMPEHMLAKCFDEETEILTTRGFERFSDVRGEVLQVTAEGLEATGSRPFVQEYSGRMVADQGQFLNFCVTPNHDMVTTLGRVEAGAMYATSRVRPTWHIPMTHKFDRADWTGISDEDLQLAGYIAADGHRSSGTSFRVKVGRQYKIDALRAVKPEREAVIHCKGKVAASDVRDIRSNFDQMSFSFGAHRVHQIMGIDKTIVTGNIIKLSQRQARIFFDAWQEFDGHTNIKTGVRRIYTSNKDHLRAIELLAVQAGYSISTRKTRTSDVSSKPNHYVTVSDRKPHPVVIKTDERPGVETVENKTGKVYCVSVPSRTIIVRRHGFSMVCGNCAEVQALRKAFPNELGGVHAHEVETVGEEPIDPTPYTGETPAEKKALKAALSAAGVTDSEKQVAIHKAMIEQGAPISGLKAAVEAYLESQE